MMSHFTDKQKQHLLFAVSAASVFFSVCFIFYNSLQDSEASHRYSGLVMMFIQNIIDPSGKIPAAELHFFIRKLAHFTEFAILGLSLFLLMICIRAQFGLSCPGTMLFSALAVAVTDEFIQSFTGRTSSIKDVLLDFCGAVFGFLFFLLLHKLHKRHKS